MKNSNEWIEDINEKVANKIAKRKNQQAVLVRLTTLTLSIMLIISAVIVYLQLAQRNPANKDKFLNSQTNQEKLVDNSTDDKGIRGLTVKNFNMDDIETNAVTDRIGFAKFIDFFQYSADSFVLVKVTDTKSARGDEPFPEKQISTIKVLENVWGDNISGRIELTQSLYGGCVGDEVTNLLRKGGVYLLPLRIYNGTYYINGDFDVQFEIDDKGLIWSHSNFTDFNRFDGSEYKTVIDEINRLTQDETFMLVASPFGMLVQEQYGWKFAEISVTAETEMGKNPFGKNAEIYNSHLEYLIIGDSLPSEMQIYSDDRDKKLPLTKGGYYLVFIDNYDGSQLVRKQMIARITEDGTIENLGDKEGPFAPYNGYTVDQIMGLVDKITEYIKNNPE